MAINKSFVVKNGLQVAQDLIFTNTDLGNVGVGTTLPSTTLEVLGQGIKSQDALFTGIVTAQGQSNLTDLSVSGISTLGTFQISSGIATASSGIITYYGDGSNLTGTVESIGVSSDNSFVGSGVTIINFIGGDDVSVTVEKSGTSANVTINADPNLDFSDIVVTGIATIGIITDTVSIGVTNVYAENIYGDASNVTGIVTSVLGGTNINVNGVTGIVTVNLDDIIDITGANISGVSTIATADITNLTVSGISTLGTLDISDNLNVTGVVTATSFSGDGSALTGLPVGSIGIQSAGTIIGTAVTTLNFIGAGNTFKITGTTVDISIQGGGGGGSIMVIPTRSGTAVTVSIAGGELEVIARSGTINIPV